jgi:hypothetical protein
MLQQPVFFAGALTPPEKECKLNDGAKFCRLLAPYPSVHIRT